MNALNKQVSVEAPKYVYELPIRIWHWLTVACLLVLGATGLVIAHPLPSSGGEASAHYSMGWIRMAHLISGEVLIVSFIGRIYWIFVGNEHARQIFYLPLWKKKYWIMLFREIGWYLFLRKRSFVYVGHNPLARASMFAMFTLAMVVMSLTGLGLHGESSPTGWAGRWFGWVVVWCGGSFTTRTIHHVGMWVLILFAMIHVYAVLREDLVGRVSGTTTMINGWRTFRDDGENDR